MDSLEQKKVRTARGFEYAYYVTPSKAASATSKNEPPALFFMHGFPDHAGMWDEVIAHIQEQQKNQQQSEQTLRGLRIVAPDLLGYDGTSKPTDPASYAYAGQATDLAEILDAEGIDKVVVVGHDWGSAVAQRFYLHKPSRVAGIVLLSVAWLAPNPDRSAPNPFADLEALNRATEAIWGYPQYAYWHFMTAPDAPSLTDGNLERLYEVMHGDEPDWMRQIFCTRGAIRAFLLGEHPLSGKVALKPYAQKQIWRDRFFDRFRGVSFAAPLQYYVAAVEGVQTESDRSLPDGMLGPVSVPVLYVGSTGDAVCRHEMIEMPRAQGLLPDLEVHVIESGHWMAMEKPKEVGGLIWGFLEKRFLGSLEN